MNPSRRLDGLLTVFIYPGEPAWEIAERLLHKGGGPALSNGRYWVGTDEEMERFLSEVAQRRIGC